MTTSEQKAFKTAKYNDKLLIYVNLAAAAVKANLAGSAMVFDVLKHYARTHNGAEFLTKSDIENLLTVYGISKRRVSRYLKAGEGIFWTVWQYKRDHRQNLYHIRAYGKVCIDLGVNHPGKAYVLPIEAYQGKSADYAAYVVGAWISAHSESSRIAQSNALGRTKHEIRRMQQKAEIQQEQRVIKIYPPRNAAQKAELAALLQNKETAEKIASGEYLTTSDSLQKHHWRGPGGVYYVQDTNQYLSGRVKELGKKRAGYIFAQAESLCDSRVNVGKTSVGTGAATSSIDEKPKRFESYSKAHKYQNKDHSRKALVRASYRVPKARPRPTTTLSQVDRASVYEFSYSYGA